MTRLRNVKRWWPVAAIWSATIIGIAVVANVHPNASMSATLFVRRISIETDAKRLLGPIDNSRLSILGVRSLEVKGRQVSIAASNGRQGVVETMPFEESTIQCAFTSVRISGLNLSRKSAVVLQWNESAGPRSLSLISRVPLAGSVTAQSDDAAARSSCDCYDLSLLATTQRQNQHLVSWNGGDTASFLTAPNTRIDLTPTSGNIIQDTQLRVLGDMSFVHIDPDLPATPKSVLLPTAGKMINDIQFDSIRKDIMLDVGDNIFIRPGREFYIQSFKVDEGIELHLRGTVVDVEKGAICGHNANVPADVIRRSRCEEADIRFDSCDCSSVHTNVEGRSSESAACES